MSLRQVGVINDYTVIEAVGRTLASLLMTEMEDPVTVTVSSPGEDYGAPVGSNGQPLGTSRVNLFLYHLEEPAHSQNMDWVDIGAGRQIPYPLSLKLYYMLNIFTPDRSSNLDEHRILGDVMRVFHANPIVDPVYFEGTLNPNEPPLGVPWEELKIIRHPLPLEDLAAIWHAINNPYRLSVAYEVSVVMIEPPPHKGRRIRRVDVTHVRAEPFRGRPVINRIEPERGYAGDIVTIYGEGFDRDFLKLSLDGAPIAPQSRTRDRITFTVPENLPPGLYGLRLSSAEGSSNEVRFEEVSPFLYRLAPEMKYTEDDDFPADAAGDPLLTIWGGNFLADPPLPVELLVTAENGTVTTIPIALEQVTRNSLKWTIPASMRTGRRTLHVRQGGTRTSNALILEIPTPRLYRADPDPISDLTQQLVVVGDFFRPGHTELYVHPGAYSDPSELAPSEIVPITIQSETELRTTLPGTLANGTYQLVVSVYGDYFSEPHEITVAGT